MDTDDFFENPDENFVCLVCHNVMIDPHTCNEGHQFCLTCITEWLKRSRTCPARCSLSCLELCSLTKNRPVANLIAKLQVRCRQTAQQQNGADASTTNPQEMEGCQWAGSVEDRTNHVRNECPYTEVECKWKGCSGKFQRLKLDQHELGCEEKEVSCENCQARMKLRQKVGHVMQVCQMAAVGCPRDCGARVQRGKLENHKEECPEEEVKCAFAEHGCEVRGKRRKVGEHEQNTETLRAHLQLLAQENKVLKKELGDQKQLVRELGDQKQLISSIEAQTSGERKVQWRIQNFTTKALEKQSLLSKTVSISTNNGVYMLRLKLNFVRRKDSLEQGYVGIALKHDAKSGGSTNFPLGLSGTRIALQKGEKEKKTEFVDGSEIRQVGHGWLMPAFCSADKIPGLKWDDKDEIHSGENSNPMYDITEFLEGDVLTVSTKIKITPPEVVDL